jgi:hypothetical protein
MYCGNNLAHKKLVNGELQIGTRYKCLKRGIGRGLNMPFDNSYLGEYIPIDDTRIYCGNSEQLPNGYDRFGSLDECQSKGIGIGMKQKADNIVKKVSKNNVTKKDLVELCKELKIKGYSRLNKEQLLQQVLNRISS